MNGGVKKAHKNRKHKLNLAVSEFSEPVSVPLKKHMPYRIQSPSICSDRLKESAPKFPKKTPAEVALSVPLTRTKHSEVQAPSILEKFNRHLQTNPDNAFEFALIHGALQLMRIAQSKGADVHIQDMFGDTYLSRAVSGNNIKEVQLLCEFGADLTQHYHYELEMLDHPFSLDTLKVAQCLFGHKVNINQLDNRKRETLGKSASVELMKLFFSQIKNNKTYPLSATFISEDEIEVYLSALKSSKEPVNEVFAVRSHGFMTHWYTAQIAINESAINLLITDSFRLGKWSDSHFHSLTEQLKKQFPKHQISIYIPKTVRQSDWHSCSIFCLYDILDLRKAKRYLPIEGDIFSYVKENTFCAEELTGFTLHYTKLPLRMMRATQSRALLDTIVPSYPKKERALPINKKKETAYISASKAFVQADAPTDRVSLSQTQPLKSKNSRITHKFDKTISKTVQYIETTPIDEITEAMKSYGLSGVRKRLLDKT